jgi:hypothetical protein
MLIDEPSSSSPADGDARLTDAARRPPHRANAASAPALPHRASVTSVPAPSHRGRGGAAPRAEQPLAPARAPRAAQPPAAPRSRAERAPAGDRAPRAAQPPAPDRSPHAAQPPAGSRAPRDPRLIETAGAPAPEALRATTIAAAVVRELYESGREVRFAFSSSGERVTVLLCDMDGVVLSRLTPARALEIATGEPVPGGRRR